MGCSSGLLKLNGAYEPSGMVLKYLLAGSPGTAICITNDISMLEVKLIWRAAVVANLWDVTDKDIDRFTAALLDQVVPTSSDDTRTLVDAVATARGACVLPRLVGAAPVVYGFPLPLKSLV
jgi:separase